MSALTRFLDTLSDTARAIALKTAKHWRRRTTFLRSRETVLGERSRDGRTRYEWHRGSLRRFPPKVKGKAAVKAAKRARIAQREAAQR